MKQVVIFLLVCLSFTQCNKDEPKTKETQIRENAWNALTAQQKSTITTNWETAPITESTFNNTSAYVVTYQTTDNALLGPITVYVDKKHICIFGPGFKGLILI